MADNITNNQNILIEHDYDNITVIDPNRVVNSDGTITERLVNHEELVKYANLEAIVIPRTKLVNGINFDDSIQNIRIGTMQGGERNNIDFLRGRTQQKEVIKQTENQENYFDTNYTDDFTSKYGKDPNDIDTQLLGLTNIEIKISSALIPEVKIDMTDVQGRVLFEQGENSPYSAFLQQPYPLFILTVKGYYGKAIRYELMLEKFNVTFDPSSGNYLLSANFIARTFALLNDITLGYLYAAPKMYNKKVEVGPLNSVNQNLSNGTIKTSEFNIFETTRGKDLLRNVYSFYRSKGLIGDDFPDQQNEPMTLEILIKKLERFEEYVMDSYGTEDMSVLINLKKYREITEKYNATVVFGDWFSKNIDNNPLVLNRVGSPLVYGFKKELTYNQKTEALVELNTLIDKYNTELLSDKVFGSDGSYTINGIKYNSYIPVTIKYSDIAISLPNLNDLDYVKTFITRNNSAPTDEEIIEFTNNIKSEYLITSYVDTVTLEVEDEQINSIFFKFGDTYDSSTYSENSFLKKISDIQKELETKRKEIEDRLTTALSEKIKSNDIGLGFNPTINNVIAVISANADAFLRLMDEVHEEAWNKRKSKIRVQSILGSKKEELTDSVDTISESSLTNYENRQNFVYPWPSYGENTVDDEGNSIIVEKYPGDSSVINLTKGYRYDEWPEIEFVEEYIKASLQKEKPTIDYRFENEYTVSKYINFNPIEFPFYNTPYVQLNDLSVYYEIIERSLLFFWLTKFDFKNTYETNLVEFFSDIIVNNIKESVLNSPDLSKKLKDYKFTYDKILEILEKSTNPGDWNLYERDEYITKYIKNLTLNDYGIYKESFVNTGYSLSGVDSTVGLNQFLNSEESGKKTFLDTYPFTNQNWLIQNLSAGITTNLEKSYKVNQTISFLEGKKTLSSFNDNDDTKNDKQVLTNFSWRKPLLPITEDFISDNVTASRYYLNRNENQLYLTESYINYGENYESTKNNLINKQTTSFLNTPYFINSIIEGNENKRNGNENPYISLGYLYLNSLPLSTLSEKFKSYNGGSTKELDYIFSTLNNYSAIHRLPYAWILKMGSIYHRYKKSKIEGVDILNNVWKDFDYKTAYDPITQQKDKLYTIQDYTGGTTEIKLESTQIDDVELVDLQNGFYPKLINEIYYLFSGKNILEQYNQDEINNLYYKNLKTGYSTKDFTILPINHDTDNTNRILRIKNWTTFFEIKNNEDFKDIQQNKILIVPSYGWLKFNQPLLELSKNDKLLTPYIDNPAVYNGSIRALWSSSNYGYFNNDWIVKPTPNQYIKTIDNTKDNRQSFNLESENKYHSVEELFSVFTKDMLDEFERHFLNFCQSEDKFNSTIVNRGSTTFDDFLQSPEVKKQYPDGVIPYEDIFRLKQQYENYPSTFTYSVEENKFFNITQAVESLFFVDGVTITNEIDQDLSKIKTGQTNNFITKHYEKFLNTKVILKIGNAGKYDRKIFNKFYDYAKSYIDSFGADIPTDNFGFYVKNSLPTSEGTTTLSQSISNYPNEWDALYQYIGDYDDNDMKYKDSGSYITDFFVDMNIEFSVFNISTLHQIIKIYATSKKENPEITVLEFFNQYSEFINSKLETQKNTLNRVFTKLNQQLPDINIEYERSTESVLDSDAIKFESWKELQWLNDRWVAGQDFKNRTIFEEFLFLDAASRPIGDKIMINIEMLRQRLLGKPKDMSLYTLIGYIIDDNDFTFIPTPVYSNYYGLNDRVRNAKPSEDVKNKIANDMFGTFMEVDVRETRPKMVAIYNNQISKDLDFRNNKNIKRNDDAVDLSDPAKNTLIENLNNVEDFSKRNKVIGFNVDFGNQEQGVFKSISIDTNQFKNTAESNRSLVDIASQYSGQPVIQQPVSLYEVYKSRSYTCNVTTIGNVMIQPTSYFILKHIPMFNGPYYIMGVNHKITPDNFETSFEGVRISKYSIQTPNKLVASVNKKVLKSFENKILNSVPYLENTENESLDIRGATESPENMCSEVTQYKDTPFVSLSWNRIKQDDFINYINGLSIDKSFKEFIYCSASIGNKFNSGSADCVNNNMFDIQTNKLWSSSYNVYITGQTCVSNDRTSEVRSYVSFDKFEKSVDFFKDYFTNNFPEYYNNLRNYSNGTDINGNNFSNDRKTAETYYRIWYAFWVENFGTGLDTNDLNNTFNLLINSDNEFKKQYYKLFEYFLISLNQISGKFT